MDILEKAAAELGLNDMDPDIARMGGDMDDVSAEGSVPFVASAGASLPSAATAKIREVPQPRQMVDPASIKHYICLYPCYFNPSRKASEGRRLPKEVLKDCFDPHPYDIAESCQKLGFKSICIETKRHPADWAGFHGRVRIELKDKTGTPIVPTVPTKERLLSEIAKLIPTLESRKARLAHFAAQKAAFEARKAAEDKKGGVKKDAVVKKATVVKKKGK